MKRTNPDGRLEKLYAKDLAQAARYCRARSKFLELLLKHPESPLQPILRNWEQLLAHIFSDARSLKELEKLLGTALEALVNPLIDFVRAKIKPPWPWVAADLFHFFSRLALAAIKDRAGTIKFGISFLRENDEIPLREPNEPPADYAKRILNYSKQQTGRKPKSGGRHINVWTEWYFRHYVLGESKNHIAKADQRLDGVNRSDLRPVVQNGIKQIEYLFSLTIPPSKS